jgi:hypothetical protein
MTFAEDFKSLIDKITKGFTESPIAIGLSATLYQAFLNDSKDELAVKKDLDLAACDFIGVRIYPNLSLEGNQAVYHFQDRIVILNNGRYIIIEKPFKKSGLVSLDGKEL